MTEGLLLAALTFVAAWVGTVSGFGTSTVMVPALSLFIPIPATLLFVGIIHLFGDIWKVILFKKGLNWPLIITFGLSGIGASYLGASLMLHETFLPLHKLLGSFLIIYVIFLLTKKDWALPKNNFTALTGGLLSGFFAGFFGVGGAVRGAFLAAFNLPKEVYICTSGMIALFIDSTRIYRYFSGGTQLEDKLALSLFFCIPVSFCGAWCAKKMLATLPRKHFRTLIAIFILLVGIKLILF